MTDQSDHGALIVLGDNLSPAEAARLQKSRWAIINVWRPLKTVRREPLAICDAKTVTDDDFRTLIARLPEADSGNPLATVSKSRDQEALNVKYSPKHQWHYYSEMEPEQALLIKCFDSKKDGRARRAPHCAFQSPQDHGPARESFEVRSIVFWEDQEVE
jgi:hypothetical protein